MKSNNVISTEESAIRETLIWLLEDFREHAEVVFQVQKDIESADIESDRFNRTIAKADAALTSLEVTVPALLRELDRLDDIPPDE